MERGLPGRDCQKRNLARHPALWPGTLEALDRISCPEPDQSEDAMLQDVPQRIAARHPHSQTTEIQIRVALINRLNSLGTAEIICGVSSMEKGGVTPQA